MHITNDMIRTELRPTGMLIRRVMPYFTENKFRELNKIMEKMKHKNLSPSLRMDEIYIPGEDGTELRVVILRPKHTSDRPVPGLVWMHGGGYAIGVPEQDVSFAELFEEKHDCVIFMPDYTLSTKAPYPAAFNDCYSTLLYMKQHADEYGINRDQIFTGGNSAGGGLCVAINLKAKDTGDVNIAFTMPLYPMIDPRKTPSSEDNDAPVWNTKSNEEGWRLYLGGNEMEKYAAPALESDLEGFPPTLTYVGTIDPFYDETMDLLHRLKETGIPVAHAEYAGCFHGFDIVASNSKVGRDARNFLGDNFELACRTRYARNC